VPGQDPTDFAAFVAADESDTATAYFARSAELMGRIAGVLGRDDACHRCRRDRHHGLHAVWR